MAAKVNRKLPVISANGDRSRARQEAVLIETQIQSWTRGESARPLDTENSFRRAIEYTLHEQGPDLGGINAE